MRARADGCAGPGASGPRVTSPAECGVADDTGFPVGAAIDFDPDTRQLAPDVLFGGSPARMLRLSAAGQAALAELRAGPVSSPGGSVLARKLTDTGLAHPRAGQAAGPLDLTVVVPVWDRAAELGQCLAAAGRQYPVLVVDDGSADPAAVAAVAAAHGARVARRERNGGPGPARNTALTLTGTELVAFLDSDCVPPPDWIDRLAGHFADPFVAAVAPRIVGAAASPDPPSDPQADGRRADGRRAGDRRAGDRRAGDRPTGDHRGPAASGPSSSPLDLGDRPARVAPMTRVAYVPTAALLVRRAVLGDGFDEALRYGEDADLVWRLIEAGWRVRYEPRVRVAHTEPAARPALLARRFRYGTSAAPLTRRHPGAVAPLVLQPWPTITMAALLARRPLVAAAAFWASTELLESRLRASELPAAGVARPMAAGVAQTCLGTGRWCAQFAAPALLVTLARPGGATARTRWGRRLAAAALLAGPPLTDWARQRGGRSESGSGPGEGPLRFSARTLADQAAYGAGVYAGCLREGIISPVLPAISWKPFEGLRTRRAARAARPRS